MFKRCLCALALIVLVAPATTSTVTQNCTWETDLPNQDSLKYYDCEDEWCFSFISANEVGGYTAVQKGCEARSLLKHQKAKAMDLIFNDDSSWIYSEPFWNAPRCSEIVAAADYAIGKDATKMGDFDEQTTRVCLNMEFKQKGVPSKGKVCCCRGSAYCNENVMWSEQAISADVIDAYRRDHDGMRFTLFELLTNTRIHTKMGI